MEKSFLYSGLFMMGAFDAVCTSLKQRTGSDVTLK